MAEEWRSMTAAELGRRIGRGAIAPDALTEDYLEAIAAHPAGAQIYARGMPERARAEAAAATRRARAGTRRGPLDGVPISWKDLFDTAGVETASGSALLAGRVPKRDALVLARATAAGSVALGKTHQTELAFSGLGLNPVTATPPNALDPSLAPGGSSSGAASSVAHGLAAAGIGSDTGGSVRIPAAWQDLVGLKTGHGVLPLDGVVPLCAGFDTVGPLCRSVEDAALLFDVMAGRAAEAPAPVSLNGRRLLALDAESLSAVDAAPVAAYEAALTRLSAAGALIEPRRLRCVDAAMPLSSALFAPEAYATWRAEIDAGGDKMYPLVRDRFLSGAEVSALDYIGAWQELYRQRAAYRADTAGFDAVVLPSCPILPPPVRRLLDEPAYFLAQNLLALRNTRVANLMGLAAVTLPTGTPSCGLMLMRPSGEEHLLLALSAAAERALG